MKTVQYFTDEYLEQCRQFSTEQIIQFLEDFRLLHGATAVNATEEAASKLISIKMPPALLSAFRSKATLHGVPYQTMIKRLMENWLKEK